MILERTKDEILVRMAPDTDLSELQDMLDYLKLQEATRNSQATPAQVKKLAKSANSNIWQKVKKERKL